MEYSDIHSIKYLLEKGIQEEYSSVADAMTFIKSLEDALKGVLERKIVTLKRSEVENNPSRAGLTTTTGISLEYLDRYPERIIMNLKSLANYWHPDIRYRIDGVYKNLIGTKSGLSVDVVYKMDILTSMEDLDSQLEDYIKQSVEALMQASLIQTSDRDVLKAMYDCFYDSEDVYTRKYIERALKRNFYIELVEFIPTTQYADNTYFEVSDAANVEKPMTTRKAVVSRKDNSCIIKGHYVLPKLNNYE